LAKLAAAMFEAEMTSSLRNGWFDSNEIWYLDAPQDVGDALWSKSKPEVDFKYSDRLIGKTGNRYISAGN